MADNTILSARLPRRELAIAAYNAQMTDCTLAEISKYAILRMIGHDHESAKSEALSQRKAVKTVASDMRDAGDKPTSVQVPREWLDMAKELMPDANASTIYRYAVLTLSHDDAELAMKEAQRSHGGGWTKGKPRKVTVD